MSYTACNECGNVDMLESFEIRIGFYGHESGIQETPYLAPPACPECKSKNLDFDPLPDYEK